MYMYVCIFVYNFSFVEKRLNLHSFYVGKSANMADGSNTEEHTVSYKLFLHRMHFFYYSERLMEVKCYSNKNKRWDGNVEEFREKVRYGTIIRITSVFVLGIFSICAINLTIIIIWINCIGQRKINVNCYFCFIPFSNHFRDKTWY